MRLEAITGKIGDVSKTFGSLLKVALMSKGASPASDEGKEREIVIMGNGPSLRSTIDDDADWLLSHDLMAVNFAANAPDFKRLRPQYYILADGHFFRGKTSDPNVAKLWDNISRSTWDMTLLVPVKFKHLVRALLFETPNIKTRYFNLTPVEGIRWVSHILYKVGLGMPRPRNVLIPAIMEAIRLGYKKIWICGADHTWTRTLSVDDENFVVSVQPHFYKDNEEEHARVRETYKGLKLHDVLGSMTIAFRSYWDIATYAKKNGIEIINATPGSMIDAFPRRPSHSSTGMKA